MLRFEEVSVPNRLYAVSALAEAGQFIHVMGTNGSGKSSLMQALAGLLDVEHGTVMLHNKALQDYSLPQLAGLRCLQEQHNHSVFELSVSELLYFFSGQRSLPESLEKALELKDFLQRPLNHLSGGEAGRVHIARALLQIWPAINQGQALILLDEPNQGLDFKHQHLLFRLLADLSGNNNLVIVNHHDLNLCQQYAQHIWLMQQGRIVHVLKDLGDISDDALAEIFGCRIDCATNDRGNKIFQTYLD